MHVLIATDGSERSIAAARRGRVLLRDPEKITLLSVITDGTPDDDAGGIEGPVLTPEEQAAMWREELSEAEKELAVTASSALPDVPVEKVVEVGDAAAAICQVAERLGVDVIIVGSHGRTGLARVFLGSVSEHVVRHAPCPVLVIPNRAQ
jgi:nucleotide-binding universal stress UspA family protein